MPTSRYPNTVIQADAVARIVLVSGGQGPTGPTGTAGGGPTGPTGPAGASGAVSVYALLHGTAGGSPLSFSDVLADTGGFFNPGTPTVITLPGDGLYSMTVNLVVTGDSSVGKLGIWFGLPTLGGKAQNQASYWATGILDPVSGAEHTAVFYGTAGTTVNVQVTGTTVVSWSDSNLSIVKLV